MLSQKYKKIWNEMSDEELKEIFQQYKEWYYNGEIPSGSKLKDIHSKYFLDYMGLERDMLIEVAKRHYSE